MTRAWCPVLVSMAALVWLLPAPPIAAQDETNWFVRGVEKFQRGEYDQAVVDLTKATEQHPDWEVAWYYLGAAQFEAVYQSLAAPRDKAARDYSAAERSLQEALKLSASRPGVRLYLGRIEEARGNWIEAAQWYGAELSLKRLGDRNMVRTALARVHYRAGKYQETIDLATKVLGEEPRYVEARYWLGLAQSALKDYKAAVATFKKAITTLTEWSDRAFHLLRVNYIETHPEDPERATRVFNDWDELRKELWGLRQAAARPEKVSKSLEQLAQDYGRAQHFALDLHLWPDLNKALGDAYMGLKDWAAARNAYRDAQDPRLGEGSKDDPDTWARIGRAYFLNGRQTFEEKGLLLKAIDELKAAEGDQTSADPQQWDGFARALYVAGISKTAKLQDMEPPPEPDVVLAGVFDGLGEMYLFQANTYASDPARGIKSHTHDEALENFDKALLFCPTYVPAMLHRAQALLSRAEVGEDEAQNARDRRAARELLERNALALEPNNPDLWAELARAYLGAGNLEEDLKQAEQAAKKALSLDTNHVVALNVAGLVQYYRRQFVEAAAQFSRATTIAPRDFQSYLNLGNAMYGMRSWARARAEYKRALDLIPHTSVANTGNQRPYLLYLIAATLHQQKLYDQAIRTLGETLSLRTDYYEARRLLAASYAGLEQWDAAVEALQACIKLAPDDRELASSHAHLGQVYERQGRLHEAVAEYRIALELYPESVEASTGLQRLAWRESAGSSKP